MQGEKEGFREFRSLGDVANRNMNEQARDDINCEQFIDGIHDAQLQELLLREEFESFSQAITRAQSLEPAKKTARTRSERRPNYIRELHGASKFVSGITNDDREMGNARRAGAELRRTQTSTDQKLDELASQMELQSLQHDELATQMQLQFSRLNELVGVQNDLLTQMQSMTAMIGRFVNSVNPAPHPQSLPRQETAQQHRQLEMVEKDSLTGALVMAQRQLECKQVVSSQVKQVTLQNSASKTRRIN